MMKLQLKPAVVASRDSGNNKPSSSASARKDRHSSEQEAFSSWHLHMRNASQSQPRFVELPTSSNAATPMPFRGSLFPLDSDDEVAVTVVECSGPSASSGSTCWGSPTSPSSSKAAVCVTGDRSASLLIRKCRSMNGMIPLSMVTARFGGGAEVDPTIAALPSDAVTIASGCSPTSTVTSPVNRAAFAPEEIIRSPQTAKGGKLLLSDSDGDDEEARLLLMPDIGNQALQQQFRTKPVQTASKRVALDGLQGAIDHIWNETHREASFETEELRHRLCTALSQECLVYFDEVSRVFRDEPEKVRATLWTTCLPLPRFSKSPFGEQLVRLIRWLNSWKAEGDRAPDPMEVFRSEEQQLRRALIDGTGEEGGFVVNDRGQRASIRQLRKEALEREKAEEAERRRQAQKGYFGRGDDGPDGNSGGSLSNLAVISGPAGIGKTALVEQAAALAGYRIIEINTSMRRCPKSVERMFAEATQTRQIKLSKDAASVVVKLQQEFEAIRSMVQKDAAAAAAAAASTTKDEIEVDDGPTTAVASKGDAAAKSAPKKRGRPPKVTKPNVISKEAIANFFKRPGASFGGAAKSAPPKQEVFDVDEPMAINAKERAHTVVDDEEDVSELDENDALLLKKEEPTSDSVVQLTSTPSDQQITIVGDSAAPTPTTTSTTTIVHHSVDADAPLTTRDTTGTLILVESGDVLFDDESGFYSTLKRMARESKFPVVITANDFSPAQVVTLFGAGTPQAEMKAPDLMYSALQLFVILAVVRNIDLRNDPDASSGVSLMREVVDFIRDVADNLEQEEGDIRSLLLNFQLRVAGSDPRLILRSHRSGPGGITDEEVESEAEAAAESPPFRRMRFAEGSADVAQSAARTPGAFRPRDTTSHSSVEMHAARSLLGESVHATEVAWHVRHALLRMQHLVVADYVEEKFTALATTSGDAAAAGTSQQQAQPPLAVRVALALRLVDEAEGHIDDDAAACVAEDHADEPPPFRLPGEFDRRPLTKSVEKLYSRHFKDHKMHALARADVLCELASYLRQCRPTKASASSKPGGDRSPLNR